MVINITLQASPFNEVRDAFTVPALGSGRIIGPQNHGATGRNAVKGRKNVLFLWRYPMLSIFRRLMKNEQGATAIEYTLIASLIAVAAIVAMGNVGTKVNGVLSNVANTMT